MILVHRFLLIGAVAAALVFGAACSTLIGNVKPVDEKSETYGVADLARENSDWIKLSAAEQGLQNSKDPRESSDSQEIPDIAFQSKQTASIISLNSACRPNTPENIEKSDVEELRNFSQQLLLGISDVTQRDEKVMTVQKSPALETTIQGKLNGEAMMLRTVVLRRARCVYDLMYVARPERFSKQESDFSHFVASLKLKE